MMKKLTTIFALIAVCATASMATETRVLTLGDNHEVLVDDANIFTFPSRIGQFPNIAVAEIGSYYFNNDRPATTGAATEGGSYYDLGRVGVNWKFGTENPWMLGTYFFTNVQDPMWGAGSSQTVFGIVNELFAPYGFQEVDNLANKRINLIYGRKLGEVNFGLGISYTSSGYKQSVPTPEAKESASQIAVNVGLSDKAYTWDIAANVTMNNFKQEDNNVNFESDGSLDFGVMGRLFHSVNPQWTLVPVAGLQVGTLGVKVPADGAVLTENIKYTSFTGMVGCGIHYMPSNNVLAVLQPGLAIGSWKREHNQSTTPTAYATEDKEDEFVLPYFKMGVEGDVFPWLDARFGTTSYWLSEKFTSKDNPAVGGDQSFEETYNSPDNSTYLGFGFNFGRLHVDTYTDPSLFLNGFNFISGQNTQMNFQLSALMELF